MTEDTTILLSQQADVPESALLVADTSTTMANDDDRGDHLDSTAEDGAQKGEVCLKKVPAEDADNEEEKTPAVEDALDMEAMVEIRQTPIPPLTSALQSHEEEERSGLSEKMLEAGSEADSNEKDPMEELANTSQPPIIAPSTSEENESEEQKVVVDEVKSQQQEENKEEENATPPPPSRPRPVLRRCTPARHPERSSSFSVSMEDKVSYYLQARMAGSPFFGGTSADSLPVLDTNEINLGELLGQGEFGRVREVIEIEDKASNDGISRLLRESRHGSHNRGGGSSHHLGGSNITSRTITCSNISSAAGNLSSQGLLMMAESNEEEEDSENSDDDSFCNAEGPSAMFSNNEPTTTTATTDCWTNEPSLEFVEIEEARRARKVLKKRCWRQGKARYAVKQLKEELLVPSDESEEFHMGTIGAMDLAMEAALLARLSHPNIVKLRATAGIPGRPDYMLVLDRLYTTLDHQILEWKLEQPTSNPIKQFFGMGGKWNIRSNLTAKKQHRQKQKTAGGKESQDFARRKGCDNPTYKSNSKAANRLIRQGQLLQRLYAAFDVARALRHLHQNKIVYRDLKPQNIASDIRGDVRIFDFGLAKELVEADLVQAPDDYNATGMTGSRRWMSPEVYYCEPYGLSADVYSFGLLLWNLCTLQTPFGDNLTLKSHHNKVMVKGQRPKKPKSKLIPENLWMLMTLCWSKDRDERPSMDIIVDVLRESISTVKMDIQEALAESTEKTVAPASTSENPAAADDCSGPALDATFATQPLENSAMFSSRTNSNHATASTIESSSPTSSFRWSIGVGGGGGASKQRHRPIIKLFGGSKKEDPVNVSYHHHPSKQRQNGRISRHKAARQGRGGQQQPQPRGRRHSRFLPKNFQFRDSDLEQRSEYLLEKSFLSLANLQTSSAHLGSSGGSRRSSRNISVGSGLNSPALFSTRGLFGDVGNSVWNVVTTGNTSSSPNHHHHS